MKNNLYRLIYYFKYLSFVSLVMIFCCNVDEIPPEIAGGIRGWFTIDENNIGVNITWYDAEDEDLEKYIIYKAKNGLSPEEIGETEENYFVDTNVDWLEFYEYYIQSVDKIGNKSELSDSVLVRIYSASGRWDISEYDSSYLCINHNQTINTGSGIIQQKGYHLADGYELIINDDLDNSTAAIGDTIFSKMLFSACSVDSLYWDANGWMTFQYTVLDTTINGDTMNSSTNHFPVYYSLDISDPSSGEISFSSPLFNSINIEHSLKYCNGNLIFD
ncbi:MAG: hypothetical protein VYC61_00305 [Candidatus Neomarinimicrobiota bacterium]|nr:hypothetical protein [Candidatus Neomarinimicrobiota bacterium]